MHSESFVVTLFEVTTLLEDDRINMQNPFVQEYIAIACGSKVQQKRLYEIFTEARKQSVFLKSS